MAGGNFLGRIISYVVNELVVEGLANNPSFQRFAVRTSKAIEEASTKGDYYLLSIYVITAVNGADVSIDIFTSTASRAKEQFVEQLKNATKDDVWHFSIQESLNSPQRSLFDGQGHVFAVTCP
ncbi:hypothetical protein ZIOFF_033858 [Zingiber officinale]|uniref:Uncharacterized protein n=1 Tax=Zingiber officinale TaxID=94328 RepID=A0A8J5GK59_ZINOF|nr:hypothetical protein ZIOFF_033858 [Zingiber officinale]